MQITVAALDKDCKVGVISARGKTNVLPAGSGIPLPLDKSTDTISDEANKGGIERG